MLGAAGAHAAGPTPPNISTNWAGYVATGGADAVGHFTSVSARWIQPKADCASVAARGPTAASFWVGLGGNAENSNSLEQAGSEADCTPKGVARYYAWYELVPADSVQLRFNVTPGDTLEATVSVHLRTVTLTVRNVSQGTHVTERLTMADPDTSSAEWIAEAPALCGNGNDCSQQRLTDFGQVHFSDATTASAVTSGAIDDSAWSSEPVTLQFGAGHFSGFDRFGGDRIVDEAEPSSLSQAGSAFSVSWHERTSPGPPGGGGYGGGFGDGFGIGAVTGSS
jgi:hypothetical protein